MRVSKQKSKAAKLNSPNDKQNLEYLAHQIYKQVFWEFINYDFSLGYKDKKGCFDICERVSLKVAEDLNLPYNQYTTLHLASPAFWSLKDNKVLEIIWTTKANFIRLSSN